MRPVILSLAILGLAIAAAPPPGRAQPAAPAQTAEATEPAPPAALAQPTEAAQPAENPAPPQAACGAAHCLYLPAISSVAPVSVESFQIQPAGGKYPLFDEVFATVRNNTLEPLCDVRVSMIVSYTPGEPPREESVLIDAIAPGALYVGLNSLPAYGYERVVDVLITDYRTAADCGYEPLTVLSPEVQAEFAGGGYSIVTGSLRNDSAAALSLSRLTFLVGPSEAVHSVTRFGTGLPPGETITLAPGESVTFEAEVDLPLGARALPAFTIVAYGSRGG